LVWSDEFNGTGAPNAANWNYHVGNGYNTGIPGFQGWGNNELEWYRPENCFQSGGNLVIRAEFNPITTNGRTFDWRSCRITTQGKRSWRYGRIEARLSSPSVQGKWNAFWMLGDSANGSFTTSYNPPVSHYDTMASNWASCGEIDIFENVNQDAFTFHHIFWDTRTGVFPFTAGMNGDTGGQGNIANTEAFHVYAMEWDATQQRYYVDGVLTWSVNITPANMEEFHKPFHIIFNMALGGNLTFGFNPIPAQFPRDMLIDYVRVYQR
jgi:beta-glucanase (GH16 family)